MKTQDFVSDSTFVSVYRIGLVRDEHVKFDRVPLCGPAEALRLIQNLILTMGQLTGNSSVYCCWTQKTIPSA